MKISGTGGSTNLPDRVNASWLNDVEGKGIQNQITDAQQQIQKLSSNQELTEEEKKQKRQDVQKQIAELNRQLRQHQAEIRRKQMEEQAAKAAEQSERERETGTKTSVIEEEEKAVSGKEELSRDLPEVDMSAVVSADTAVNQAGIGKRVVVTLEAKTRTIRGEIKQDQMRGQNTEKKERELKEIEQRISNVFKTQISALSDADKKARQNARQDIKVAVGPKSRNSNDAVDMAGMPRKDAEKRQQDDRLFASVNIQVH